MNAGCRPICVSANFTSLRWVSDIYNPLLLLKTEWYYSGRPGQLLCEWDFNPCPKLTIFKSTKLPKAQCSFKDAYSRRRQRSQHHSNRPYNHAWVSNEGQAERAALCYKDVLQTRGKRHPVGSLCLLIPTCKSFSFEAIRVKLYSFRHADYDVYRQFPSLVINQSRSMRTSKAGKNSREIESRVSYSKSPRTKPHSKEFCTP